MLRVAAWVLSVPVAALVGGVLGLVPVLAMGLSVPILVVGPLAAVTGGLFAGLGAAWAGTLFSPDGSRSHLLGVLLVSEVAAVFALAAGAALVLVPPWSAAFPEPSGDATVGEALLVCDFVVAAGASAAAWLLRYPPERRPDNE